MPEKYNYENFLQKSDEPKLRQEKFITTLLFGPSSISFLVLSHQAAFAKINNNKNIVKYANYMTFNSYKYSDLQGSKLRQILPVQ